MYLTDRHWWTGQWFSPGTRVSSTNKTNRHGITEILLKVALNTTIQTKPNRITNNNLNEKQHTE
jgi:hypothetical protein